MEGLEVAPAQRRRERVGVAEPERRELLEDRAEVVDLDVGPDRARAVPAREERLVELARPGGRGVESGVGSKVPASRWVRLEASASTAARMKPAKLSHGSPSSAIAASAAAM